VPDSHQRFLNRARRYLLPPGTRLTYGEHRVSQLREQTEKRTPHDAARGHSTFAALPMPYLNLALLRDIKIRSWDRGNFIK